MRISIGPGLGNKICLLQNGSTNLIHYWGIILYVWAIIGMVVTIYFTSKYLLWCNFFFGWMCMMYVYNLELQSIQSFILNGFASVCFILIVQIKLLL